MKKYELVDTSRVGRIRCAPLQRSRKKKKSCEANDKGDEGVKYHLTGNSFEEMVTFVGTGRPRPSRTDRLGELPDSWHIPDMQTNKRDGHNSKYPVASNYQSGAASVAGVTPTSRMTTSATTSCNNVEMLSTNAVPDFTPLCSDEDDDEIELEQFPAHGHFSVVGSLFYSAKFYLDWTVGESHGIYSLMPQ